MNINYLAVMEPILGLTKVAGAESSAEREPYL